MVLDGKSSQEYPTNAVLPPGSILDPTPFVLYINDLPDVIYDIAIYADNTAFYLKCDQASNLWCFGWLSLLNWIGALILSLLLKVHP